MSIGNIFKTILGVGFLNFIWFSWVEAVFKNTIDASSKLLLLSVMPLLSGAFVLVFFYGRIVSERARTIFKAVFISIIADLLWILGVSWLSLQMSSGGVNPQSIEATIIFVPILTVVVVPIYLYSRLQGTHQNSPATETRRQLPHAAKASIVRAKTLLDIGFIAFWGKETVTAYRTEPIPTTVDVLQPFIQIRLYLPPQYRVDFEITDHNGKQVFFQGIEAQSKNNISFITPAARFRLDEKIRAEMLKTEWKLRVYTNGNLFAQHRFTWLEDNVKQVEGRVNADGEVSAELLSLLADDYAEKMSLDDLLSAQDDAQEKKQSE
jgi:hypothetical protein